MRLLLLFLLIVVFAGDAVLIFISSLYAPNWFWVMAYVILIGSAALGFFYRRGSKTFWSLALIGSLIINSHYLIAAFSANSLQAIGWGIGLFFSQSLLLFLMMTLSSKVMVR